MFGLYDEEELKSKLLGLSSAYPEFINAAFANDLKTIPQIISENPWNGLLWDGTKMVNRVSRATVKSLLIYMVDKRLLSESEYRKMVEQYAATLNIDIDAAQNYLKKFSGENT